MTNALTESDTDTTAALVDGYFECWNSTDPEIRAAAIDRTWAEDATMTDPIVEVAGHEQLAGVFAQFHVTYEGHSFRRTGGIDAHHGFVRWGWEMLDADGTVALDGVDVASLSPDGRLQHVAGFFGSALPEAG
jgi:hypothetical protein